MLVYKIIFQVEAEDVPAALAKLKTESDVLKYVVSVFPIKEQPGQSGGWSNTLKSQLFGSKK
jgi:hypothetical protein